MFQRYLLILYDNSLNLPAIRRVLSFQVLIVILFLARILLVVTPVAYFSPFARGGGGVNHLPKKFLQVAQVATTGVLDKDENLL